MPQTLLAIAAILAFSLFAIGQHKANAELEQTAMASEIELAATDVARDRLVAIASLVYDEADIGRTDLRRDATGLSAIGPDAGESTIDLFDDLDDFHGFVDTLSVDWHGAPLSFAVTANIRYVDANQPDVTSGVPTLAKEIAVSVAEIGNAIAERPGVQATLVHVVTPAWTTMHG